MVDGILGAHEAQIAQQPQPGQPQAVQSDFPRSPEELEARFQVLSPQEKDIVRTVLTGDVGAVICKMLGQGCAGIVQAGVNEQPGASNPVQPLPGAPAPGVAPGGPTQSIGQSAAFSAGAAPAGLGSPPQPGPPGSGVPAGPPGLDPARNSPLRRIQQQG